MTNFNFAKYLLSVKVQYNGHFQTEVSWMPMEDVITLCKDLEELSPLHSFVCELWTEGDITIYQKDFWKAGEHPSGHTDRMILGISANE